MPIVLGQQADVFDPCFISENVYNNRSYASRNGKTENVYNIIGSVQSSADTIGSSDKKCLY